MDSVTNRPAGRFTRGSFSGGSDEPLGVDDEPVSGGSSSKVSSPQKMKFLRVKRPAVLFCLLRPLLRADLCGLFRHLWTTPYKTIA